MGHVGQRFPIRIAKVWAPLLTVFGMPRRLAYVEIDEQDVRVRFGIGFRADFPRADLVAADALQGRRPLSIGVHGWAGRWLVNGSRDGIVRVTVGGGARGRVLGVRVRLRNLMVSLDEPDAFLAVVGTRGTS